MKEVPARSQASSLRVTFVTELTQTGDEGMANWARMLSEGVREGCVDAHVTTLQLAHNSRAGVLSPRTWLAVRESQPDVVVYVPYSGLTLGALVRVRCLKLLSPRAASCLVVLQADPGKRRTPRVLHLSGAIFGSNRLREQHSALARVSTVLPPAVDLERFVPPRVSRSTLRARLGLPDRPTILHVGHLTSNRNLGILAQIARETEYSVVVCGSTSTDPDPGVTAELRDAGVLILRRFLPRIEELYQAADVYVFPVIDPRGSSHVPLSVLEALACGCPVATTHFGCLPEFLDESPALRFGEPEQLPELASELIGRDGARRHVERFDRQSQSSAAGRFLKQLGHPQKRAQIIVLAGIDGSGKSTQAQLLADWAAENGLSARVVWGRWDPLLARPAVKLLGVLTRLRRKRRTPRHRSAGPEPPSRSRLETKRRLLRHPAIARAWDALMVVDYGIRTALQVRRAQKEVDLLILDRYWHDVIADRYAGQDPGPPPRALMHLLPDPDGVVVVDVPDGVAFERRKGDVPDPEYLADRRVVYDAMVRCGLADRVDGAGSLSAVHERIVSVVQEVIADE